MKTKEASKAKKRRIVITRHCKCCKKPREFYYLGETLTRTGRLFFWNCSECEGTRVFNPRISLRKIEKRKGRQVAKN